MRFGLQLAIVAAVLAWAIPAHAVTVTFNPNGFAYSYWINGTGGGSAASASYTWNATVGETYTVRTRGNTVTVGTFTVDSGGNVTEAAAGLTSPATSDIRFDNASITFNPGTSAYTYFLDWLVGGASGTFTTPMPKGSGSWLLWANGLQLTDNTATYSIDNSGNVVVGTVASGGVYTTSGGTLNFPTPTNVFVDVPASLGAYAGTQQWGIHFIAASFGADNFADRNLTVIPGTWGLISSSLPPGHWLGGVDNFDLPGNPPGWSQTATWVVDADGSQHTFAFFAPEPASAGLLAIGMLSLLRRRRRAA